MGHGSQILDPSRARRNLHVPELAFANEFVKPLVGILFAIAIEGSRIVIVGTIIKAKMSNDEKAKAAIEKAQANERRRMGK